MYSENDAADVYLQKRINSRGPPKRNKLLQKKNLECMVVLFGKKDVVVIVRREGGGEGAVCFGNQ